MSLPSYMRPEQPRQEGDIPTFQIGTQVEAKITSIEKTTGKFGDQYQFNVTLEPSGWNAKAWIKYYPTPQPNQHLGKLCLAIERVTGQRFSSLESAIQALQSYGRIFLIAKKPAEVEGDDGETRIYPRFRIMPDVLPGEQPQQTLAPRKGLFPSRDSQTPKTPHEKLIAFLNKHKDLIGGLKPIPDYVFNLEIINDNELVEKLREEELVYEKDLEYFIDEKARKLIG